MNAAGVRHDVRNPFCKPDNTAPPSYGQLFWAVERAYRLSASVIFPCPASLEVCGAIPALIDVLVDCHARDFSLFRHVSFLFGLNTFQSGSRPVSPGLPAPQSISRSNYFHQPRSSNSTTTFASHRQSHEKAAYGEAFHNWPRKIALAVHRSVSVFHYVRIFYPCSRRRGKCHGTPCGPGTVYPSLPVTCIHIPVSIFSLVPDPRLGLH